MAEQESEQLQAAYEMWLQPIEWTDDYEGAMKKSMRKFEADMGKTRSQIQQLFKVSVMNWKHEKQMAVFD